MKGALVVITEAPIAGGSAADLRPHLTSSQNSALQRRFLADTIEGTQDIEGVDFFVARGDDRGRAIAGDLPSPFRLISQTGPDIGGRLSSLFESLFRQGYEHVLILGSRSPDLPACLIEQGSEILAKGKADFVLGPSERGGFYLVGLSEPCRNLFGDIPWDSPGISRQALSCARGLGLRVHRLPQWYDIASIEDLRRHFTYYSLRCDAAEGSSYKSATGTYLRKIRDRLQQELPGAC